MSTIPAPSPVSVRHVSHSHIYGLMQGAMTMASVWADRIVKRRELRDLLAQDNRVLRDVGLPRDVIMREAFKAFWRA